MPSVERVAVITHGRDNVDEALVRVARVAARLGVEVVDETTSTPTCGRARRRRDDAGCAEAVSRRGVPVIGVNYGRVGS